MQRVLVARIQPQHFGERLERAVDEAAPLVVESQAQQDVRVLHARQPRTLQQALVNRDGLADLAFLAVQVPQDHVDFERVGVEAGGVGQLFDGEIDLIRDEKVQAEDVVR